jgi:hypothetical protein
MGNCAGASESRGPAKISLGKIMRKLSHEKFLKLAAEHGATEPKTWWYMSYFPENKRRKYSRVIFRRESGITLRIQVTFNGLGAMATVLPTGNDPLNLESIHEINANMTLLQRAKNLIYHVYSEMRLTRL